MTRQFASRITFSESQHGAPFPPPIAPFDDAFGLPVRVMLIAIRHDPEPPVFHGPHLLQRLQALLAAPGAAVEINSRRPPARCISNRLAESMEEAMPSAPPRLLPALQPLPPTDDGTPLRPRLVRGDILSDGVGHLYERTGRQVRPLQRVVSGPRGEILELIPDIRNATSNERDIQPGRQESAAPTIEQCPTEQPAETPNRARPRQAEAEHQARTLHPTAPPHRNLRPASRPPRTASFGAFKPPSVTQAAARPARQGEEPLQHAMQQPIARSAKSAPPSPIPSGPQAAHAAAAPNNPTDKLPNNLPDELKAVIPEPWIKSWEFHLSREEALYDLKLEEASGNSILGSVRNLRRRFGTKQAFHKWQSLLAGKGLDEQLWAVRPPAGQLAHPEVREWARQTLDQAGYDARMLPEWEIFWRRKGL
jgi:hypothetical protein